MPYVACKCNNRHARNKGDKMVYQDPFEFGYLMDSNPTSFTPNPKEIPKRGDMDKLAWAMHEL